MMFALHDPASATVMLPWANILQRNVCSFAGRLASLTASSTSLLYPLPSHLSSTQGIKVTTTSNRISSLFSIKMSAGKGITCSDVCSDALLRVLPSSFCFRWFLGSVAAHHPTQARRVHPRTIPYSFLSAFLSKLTLTTNPKCIIWSFANLRAIH